MFGPNYQFSNFSKTCRVQFSAPTYLEWILVIIWGQFSFPDPTVKFARPVQTKLKKPNGLFHEKVLVGTNAW